MSAAPPGPLGDPSRAAATPSSAPSVAAARCHTDRSSSPRAAAPRRAAGAPRGALAGVAVDGGPGQRVGELEPSPRTAPGRRASISSTSRARPSTPAASTSRSSEPPGSAAATSSSSRADGRAARPGRGTSARSVARPAASPGAAAPAIWSGVRKRTSSTRASGLPCVLSASTWLTGSGGHAGQLGHQGADVGFRQPGEPKLAHPGKPRRRTRWPRPRCPAPRGPP